MTAPDRLRWLVGSADSGFVVGEVEVLVDSPELVEQVTLARKVLCPDLVSIQRLSATLACLGCVCFSRVVFVV